MIPGRPRGPRDPVQDAQAYMRTHKVPELFRALTAALLFHQPEDPKAFLKEFLGKLKGDDVNTLITDEDLEVMFSMFDLGGTGRINVNQTNQAIKMMVGEEASLLMDEGNHVSKDEFVETCRKSLGKF